MSSIAAAAGSTQPDPAPGARAVASASTGRMRLPPGEQRVAHRLVEARGRVLLGEAKLGEETLHDRAKIIRIGRRRCPGSGLSLDRQRSSSWPGAASWESPREARSSSSAASAASSAHSPCKPLRLFGLDVVGAKPDGRLLEPARECSQPLGRLEGHADRLSPPDRRFITRPKYAVYEVWRVRTAIELRGLDCLVDRDLVRECPDGAGSRRARRAGSPVRAARSGRAPSRSRCSEMRRVELLAVRLDALHELPRERSASTRRASPGRSRRAGRRRTPPRAAGRCGASAAPSYARESTRACGYRRGPCRRVDEVRHLDDDSGLERRGLVAGAGDGVPAHARIGLRHGHLDGARDLHVRGRPSTNRTSTSSFGWIQSSESPATDFANEICS